MVLVVRTYLASRTLLGLVRWAVAVVFGCGLEDVEVPFAVGADLEDARAVAAAVAVVRCREDRDDVPVLAPVVA